MTPVKTMSITNSAISTVLEGAGIAGVSFHATTLDGSHQVGNGADDPVPSASTYKVAVLLEYACQASAHEISATERVRIPAERRSIGPTGVSAMLDEVEMSVRDLAFLMMHISDNTATDVVQEIVGTERMSARLRRLGLSATSFTQDCAQLVGNILEEFEAIPDGLDAEAFRVATQECPSLTGKRGNVTTPRDMTRLLGAIWRDEAGPADACAEVRRIMGLQYAPHRLQSAYRDDGPQILGKTGTFPGGLRNEVGVFDFGDDEIYLVAVYLRQHGIDLRDGAADAAVGHVARVAIDSLRGESR